MGIGNSIIWSAVSFMPVGCCHQTLPIGLRAEEEAHRRLFKTHSASGAKESR